MQVRRRANPRDPRALLARNGPGDADRARTLLADAKEAAASIGIAPAVAEADSLLA